jgi:EAL domain-containing protein (putative c-di-GMP-specific phosphodiesterase class I)
LKIDRTFISKIDTDSETSEIVRIIIMLAHNLGLKVVAEGAETAEQVSLLKELKANSCKGISSPDPETTPLLRCF